MSKEKRYKEINVINEILKNNPYIPEQIKVKSKRNKESNPNDINKSHTLTHLHTSVKKLEISCAACFTTQT